MGRTACTEPQCLYKGALYLTVELYLYSPYRPYGLYRASVPVQGCTLPFILCQEMLRNLNVHYRIHDSSSPLPILSQINPFLVPSILFLQTPFQYRSPTYAEIFNMVFVFHVSSTKALHPFQVYNKPRPSHVPRSDLPNNIWRGPQVVDLPMRNVVYNILFVSSFLGPKYLRHHPTRFLPHHRQFIFSPINVALDSTQADSVVRKET